jgi:putative thioredoxin
VVAVIVDVTDATFESEVVERSRRTPVVVDLWAPWCGPCKTLGPILERVVGDTDGRVVLTKVNVDDNPQVAAAFRVQGIPAVYALRDGKVVDGFVGAQGEPAVRQFVEGLLPTEEQSEVQQLVALGDEASLRSALELDPDHEEATAALAELLATSDRADEALALLARVPETAETRRIAAIARQGGLAADGDRIEATLRELLTRVKGDDEARQQFIDLLELLGPDDPRTAEYRRQLTAQLY